MNTAQIILTVVFTYVIGGLFAWSPNFACMENDEAVLWPIYFFKWILKALWKALMVW